MVDDNDDGDDYIFIQDNKINYLPQGCFLPFMRDFCTNTTHKASAFRDETYKIVTAPE